MRRPRGFPACSCSSRSKSFLLLRAPAFSKLTWLNRRKHYIKVGADLYLPWRPLYRDLKALVLPSDVGSVVAISGGPSKRSHRTILKMCGFAQLYFDPAEVPEILSEVLPYFSTSSPDTGFAVIGLLNLLLPTSPAPQSSKWQPQHFFPTLFHLWGTFNRSKTADLQFLDLFSRFARDCIVSPEVQFSPFGMFTNEQTSHIFTAVLRLLEIPVSQVTSPYSSTVDIYVGMAAILGRDQRKHPISHHIARWVVMSLSPECADAPDSMLTKLEGLIQAIETFFHPSITGAWTKNLAQLVFYLADFFVMRWNREKSGEMATPKERCLNEAVRRRFVLCLREVTFMGIFAKSGTAMSYSLSTLQSLSHLEPTLILPGALQRIYPSMRGLVEVHRTTSSIRALHELTRIMTRTKGYRCHVTSLLGLALPGIDANDLDKTIHTLTFMQAVFYDVPMWDLTVQSAAESKSGEEKLDGMIAAQWVTGQIERLEAEGVDIEIDYQSELSDTDEETILRSSTAEFHNFISSLLERVFSLLRNLPDAARAKTGSPEENVTNTLPAMFTSMFSTMSPELYDLVLQKIADFVSKHVVYQAKDAMAFICSALCKAQPEKALAVLVPIFTRAIRTEIQDNGAGSTRTTGSETLPRDRALVWNISLLSMSIVHSGSSVVGYQEELFGIAQFMQKNCKGIPSTHASNFIHHLLLTLTMIYTHDYSLYEEAEVASGVTPSHWGALTDPQKLNINWHTPTHVELDFAVRLFSELAEYELERLRSLTNDQSTIKRDGSGKEWSDEVSRSLVILRLMLSGVSVLFDPSHDVVPISDGDIATDGDQDDEMADANGDADMEVADAGATEDDDVKTSFQYSAGYAFSSDDPRHQKLHKLRLDIGETLHKVHEFLSNHQQDDVTVFNALYTTYRSWFTDVGMERSAHVLDRVTRLLVADVSPFRVSGLRKEYPRPLLVRRAGVYHLQRLRHNASPRHKTAMDALLLQDLVQSSVSYYTEIRCTAQTAMESAMRVLIGTRPLLIPPLLAYFESAVKSSDFPRIKGSMYSLLFGNLTKSVSRNWDWAPILLRTYIDVMDVDRPSIQKIATASALTIMDMTRQPSRLVILDKNVVETIAPSNPSDQTGIQETITTRAEKIKERHDTIKMKRSELSDELAAVARKSHWKKESRTATLVIGLSLRFETIASTNMVDLVVKRAIDSHPSLRTIYSSALLGLFAYIDMRAVADHDFACLLLEKKKVPGFVKVVPDREDPEWGNKQLAQFAHADAELYVDHEYPGWLVWGKTFPAFKASESNCLEYDDVESKIRAQIGAMLDKAWFTTYFGYIKQEPRDASHDRFRMSNVMTMTSCFQLVFAGLTPTTFEDLKHLVEEVFGDGSDKHQHRATAEIMAGLLTASVPLEAKLRETVWAYAFPLVRNVFDNGLTHDNTSYWSTFLDVVLQNKDPRRCWPLVEWLSSFRLDMSSNAAFKESSKISMLEHAILGVGWHFQLAEPVLQDFLEHLDHPYKRVREVIGQTLAIIYRTRYHESHKDVESLVEYEKSVSSVGSKPYQLSEDQRAAMTEVFARLEKWREERPAGQQTASPYTSGSKTVLAWLENSLTSFECTQLIPLFPDIFLEALLHMMDVKEDPELQAHAYSAFRHLGNIPYRQGEDEDFVAALVRIGKTASAWHQRLRILINIQAVYFRNLFLMPRKRQRPLFDTVTGMLQDTQLEVRVGAATTLSGMIRCSPVALRSSVIETLTKQFTTILHKNPLPRRKTIGAPTSEHSKLVLTRHGAVLGLGALVQAFPYTSPPPKWIPAILATLATGAAGDPGMVGKSAKTVVSDFKKTRQDTWHIDIKVRLRRTSFQYI